MKTVAVLWMLVGAASASSLLKAFQPSAGRYNLYPNNGNLVDYISGLKLNKKLQPKEQVKTVFGPNDFRNGGKGVDVTVVKEGPGHVSTSSYVKMSSSSDKPETYSKVTYGTDDYRKGGDDVDVTVEKVSPNSYAKSSVKASSYSNVDGDMNEGMKKAITDNLDMDMNNMFGFDSDPFSGMIDSVFNGMNWDDIDNEDTTSDATDNEQVTTTGAYNENVKYGDSDYRKGGNGIDMQVEKTFPGGKSVESTYVQTYSSADKDQDTLEPNADVLPAMNDTDGTLDEISESDLTDIVSLDDNSSVEEINDDRNDTASDENEVKEKVTYGDGDFRKGGNGVDVKVEKTFPGGKSYESSYVQTFGGNGDDGKESTNGYVKTQSYSINTSSNNNRRGRKGRNKIGRWSNRFTLPSVGDYFNGNRWQSPWQQWYRRPRQRFSFVLQHPFSGWNHFAPRRTWFAPIFDRAFSGWW